MGFKLKDLFWISPEPEPTAPPPEALIDVVLEDAPVPSARGASGSVERILASLSDVDGVVAGIAVAKDGTLLGKSPDAPFDLETLDRSGARIAQLLAALSSDGSGGNVPKGGVVRFRDRQLYLNPIASGVVGVLAESRVNVPALTMALRVVAQQLDARALSLAPQSGF
jgi:predicted regulator of Ras-like GTPase activity (Roadblock/LC7/MglB family)